MDVEAEESDALEAEGGHPKSLRRKMKRSRKDSASLAEAIEEKVQEVEFVVEAIPLPGVLMVEVDNVVHEDFQVTEEVKVLRQQTSASLKIFIQNYLFNQNEFTPSLFKPGPDC